MKIRLAVVRFGGFLELARARVPVANNTSRDNSPAGRLSHVVDK